MTMVQKKQRVLRASLYLSVRPWASSSGGSGVIWLQILRPGYFRHHFLGAVYLPLAGSWQLHIKCVERRLDILASKGGGG